MMAAAIDEAQGENCLRGEPTGGRERERERKMWKWTPRPVIRLKVAGTPILPCGHTSFLQRVKDDPSDPNNTTAKPPLRAVVRSPSYIHKDRQTGQKDPPKPGPFCSATVRSRTPGPRRSEAMCHDRARMPLLRLTARRRSESRLGRGYVPH